MSDVRISDSLAMTRNLDEFRYLDQQVRTAAERMSAFAAEKEIQEVKKEIEESDRSVADRSEDEGGRTQYNANGQRREKEAEKKELPPEVTEGHLLDLKA